MLWAQAKGFYSHILNIKLSNIVKTYLCFRYLKFQHTKHINSLEAVNAHLINIILRELIPRTCLQLWLFFFYFTGPILIRRNIYTILLKYNLIKFRLGIGLRFFADAPLIRNIQ